MSENHPADNAAPVRWLTTEQQRVWRSYLMASSLLDTALGNDLKRFGMDLAEYEVLVCLSEAENRELRMSELADAAHQSRSRLTHTVARMERSGWVTRCADPSDRRGVRAQLTDEGFAVLEQAAPSHVNAVRRFLIDAVAPVDLQALGRAMEAVERAVTSADEQAAAVARSWGH